MASNQAPEGVSVDRIGDLSIFSADPEGGFHGLINRLEAQADALPLKDPAPAEISRAGFMPFARDLPSFIALPDGAGAAVCLGVNSKTIPASAVASRVEKEIAKIELKTGQRAAVRLRKAIRDQVLNAMCAEAFFVTRSCVILFDAKAKRIFVTGPRAVGEIGIRFILGHVGGVNSTPARQGPVPFFAAVDRMMRATGGLSIREDIRIGLDDKARFVSIETGETMTISKHSVLESEPARVAMRKSFQGAMARVAVAQDRDATGNPSVMFMDIDASGRISGLRRDYFQDDGEAEAEGGLIDHARVLARFLEGCRLADMAMDFLFPPEEVSQDTSARHASAEFVDAEAPEEMTNE